MRLLTCYKVLIKPYDGDPDDRELYDLIDFLKAAAVSQEVVVVNSNGASRWFLLSGFEGLHQEIWWWIGWEYWQTISDRKKGERECRAA